MIVVDAGVVANAVGDDGADGRQARVLLGGAGDLAAPDLVDVETLAVLRRRWLAGTLTARRFSVAIEDLQALPIDRHATLPLLRRAYALRANVSAYDAVYVALAEAFACELVTIDGRLARAAGPRCPIRVLVP